MNLFLVGIQEKDQKANKKVRKRIRIKKKKQKKMIIINLIKKEKRKINKMI